jgi:hypothetical protein
MLANEAAIGSNSNPVPVVGGVMMCWVNSLWVAEEEAVIA